MKPKLGVYPGGWPLWCSWCDRPIKVGIGSAPLIACNACFEQLDGLDALLGRMPRRKRPAVPANPVMGFQTRRPPK